MADRSPNRPHRWARWLQRASRKKSGAFQRQQHPPEPVGLVEQVAALERGPALRFDGADRNWLLVLPATELLALLRASKVLTALAARSNLSLSVWQRDLLPAIFRYAEFVQLMPASESHHHAHAGGLLAHTLEMLLAAITWRNGHLLPTGATIEQVDRERDVWTYVVFFAALLHDIAKPMTDLRIQWRTERRTEPIRWTPVGGSLTQITRTLGAAEYRVEFTPKAARDYGAHSRLAVTLLRQIAPEPALILLAQTPAAMDNLVQFLSGQDKTSLVARLVRKADQASTKKALMRGNKARFATATAVPLIELMMGALKTILRSGTELPLNRSGAAGWVYQGSLWLVAKRVADEVRTWIARNAPEESVPGSTKNDRLFDTWQEYGAIERNPQTGQAVWYIIVHGGGAGNDPKADAQQTYVHSLSVLRFPLNRVYDDPSQYPPEMVGSIEVKRKRADKADTQDDNTEVEAPAEQPDTDSDSSGTDTARQAASNERNKKAGHTARSGSQGESVQATVPAPNFNTRVKFGGKNGPKSGSGSGSKKPSQSKEVADEHKAAAASASKASKRSESRETAAASTWTDDDWLIDEDDVREATRKPRAPAQEQKIQGKSHKTAAKAVKTSNSAPTHVKEESKRTSLDAIAPVRVARKLPKLPGDGAAQTIEISNDAGQFLQWLLEGLSGGDITYNQTRALVHFTAEGLALVSPIIFKEFARQTGSENTVNERAMAVQRALIKANLHLSETTPGKGRSNIMRYDIVGKGDAVKGTLSAIVLTDPAMFLADPPPPNPAIRLAGAQKLTR